MALVDFVEKPFDFNNEQKKQSFALQFLKSWCLPAPNTKEEARNLLATLTQGLENYGFNPSWNKAALDEQFVEVDIKQV